MSQVPEIFADLVAGVQNLSGQCVRLTFARQPPNYLPTGESQATTQIVLHLVLPQAVLQDAARLLAELTQARPPSTTTRQ